MSQSASQTIMEYRGYTANVKWDEESKCYSGKVMDTWGMVVFYDYTWEKAYQGFRDVLDQYLEHCEEDGEEPRLSNRELVAQSV